MEAELQIDRRLSPEPRVVTRLFSMADWTWSAVALASVPIVVYLDTTVTVGSASENSFSLSAGPFAVFYTLAVIVTLIAQIRARSRGRRAMLDAVAGRDQFIVFNDHGLRYGWEGVVEQFYAWEACGSIKWKDDDLAIRIGDHRIKIDTRMLSDEQKQSLHAFLVQRRMLAPERRPPHRDFRLSR